MSPVRLFVVLSALSLLAAAPVHAQDASRISHAREALQAAVATFKAPQLLRARATFEAMSDAEPKVAALHYWVAYADWRAVPLLERSEREKAERYVKDGLDHCERALALEPGNAEVLALKGSLQGLAIGFDPKSMMTLGVQGMMNLHRAAELQPLNPRIRLLGAINLLHKPAEFGGGAAAADSGFRQAIELFLKSPVPTDSTAPEWGRDDAYLWAGRCAARLHDWPRARDQFREALRVNPSNVWVRDGLLPEAEKALAAEPVKP